MHISASNDNIRIFCFMDLMFRVCYNSEWVDVGSMHFTLSFHHQFLGAAALWGVEGDEVEPCRQPAGGEG